MEPLLVFAMRHPRGWLQALAALQVRPVRHVHAFCLILWLHRCGAVHGQA